MSSGQDWPLWTRTLIKYRCGRIWVGLGGGTVVDALEYFCPFLAHQRYQQTRRTR